MNIRNESRSGSLFFGLKANKGSIKQMFVSGPPEQMFAFQELELGTPGSVVGATRYARMRCTNRRSPPATRPDPLVEELELREGEQILVRKFVCFFYFFSLPLYHRSSAVVKCFLENFFKKFSIFLLTCAGVSWYNVYVNGKGKENWLSRKKLEKVKKILDFSS